MATKRLPAKKPDPAPPDLGWPPTLNRLPADIPAPPAPPARPAPPPPSGLDPVGAAPRLEHDVIIPLRAACPDLVVVSTIRPRSECTDWSLHPDGLAVDVSSPTHSPSQLYALVCQLQPARMPYTLVRTHPQHVCIQLTGKKDREQPPASLKC